MNSWKLAASSPRHALTFLFRRAIPFGISFKDLEAYRISSWRHGRLPRVHLTRVFPGIEEVGIQLLNLYQRKIGLSVDAAELMVLCAIERFIGASNVLEIGTYDGNTALNLAANLSGDGRVTTVDLPTEWDRKFVYEVPDNHWNVTDRQGVGSQYRNTPYQSRIRQVLGDSAGVDWKELNPPFDLIFIDGCHYSEYVRVDTRNALANIRPGGVIVWHDYGDIKDVSRVVDETARGMTAFAIRGTRLAVGWQGPRPERANSLVTAGAKSVRS
ncbi:MAG TPA: class I SAM-dependent methyltransferase [Candidatus Acidoferrales bacterium]|nr:class I SAM-dependent methyltransferase [Candidatus Acidoferrales bacterium]